MNFKKGYQPQNKSMNGDLHTDSHNIVNKWRNYFLQLLNVHKVSDVRQIKIHAAEALVPDPGSFEVEIAITELERYNL
jgi:hypothetical protein